jgi:hypothetical protein
MRHFLISLMALILLAGCSPDEAVARAEKAVQQAQAVKADADAGLAAAEKLAEQMKTLAKSLGADKAALVIAQADTLVAQARDVSARVGEALSVAESATTAAKSAREAGGGWLDVVLGAVAVLVPGAGGAVALVRNLSRAHTAIRLTALHADRMETAETDADVDNAKTKARREQSLHGVDRLIETLRV